MGAIQTADKYAYIDYEMCVECSVCLRLGICPEGAIKQVDEIPYPRMLRAAFSDPTYRHESTKVLGRGTEEMKTNDVKNEFKLGEIGFSVELGRPSLGACLREIDKITRKVAMMGVTFADDNPVVALMKDRKKGQLKREVLGERVLSAIVEFVVPEDHALGLLDEIVHFIENELESVATLSMINRADDGGNIELMKKVREKGYEPYPNGKVNIGMALIS
jgi:Fe-S-cluster-containing hydrogenase component 2